MCNFCDCLRIATNASCFLSGENNSRYDVPMALPIYVDAYSGYKANERPHQFVLDEEIYEIAAVLDQWYEPAATYYRLSDRWHQGFFVPENTVILRVVDGVLSRSN